MQHFSILILTKNEEENIGRCLNSVALMGDETIVVDDHSSDATVDIARKHGATVYTQPLNGNFAEARNKAMAQAKSKYILFIDADEVVSDAMRKYITQIPETTHTRAFAFKRIDFFWNTMMRFGEVSNVYVTRLVTKDHGTFVRPVHEVWQGSKIKKIDFPLYHYPHPTIASFLNSINTYSSLNAEYMLAQGKKVGTLELVALPLSKFIYTYFLKLGFLDGVAGFIYSFMMSFHSFLTRAKVYTGK
ncbi:MAG: glycosyltransferase family 2 protein [Candidatus Roizmanbacteria bacterium]|nr:glycosyltransferase family 2 protein [Candidatus Roizmanbacteria bacterium]